MTGTPIKSRHREWLDARNEVSRIINDPGLTTEQMDRLCTASVLLEAQMMETRPATVDELAALMTLTLQVIAEGHEVPEDMAARLVADAMGILQLGSLNGASDDIRARFVPSFGGA